MQFKTDEEELNYLNNPPLVGPTKFKTDEEELNYLNRIATPPKAEEKGLWPAIKSGFEQSATGLGLRVLRGKEGIPTPYQPEGFVEKAVMGTAGMVSELPEMIAGGIAGGILGAETGPGAVVTAGAGTFALPAAIREAAKAKLAPEEADLGKSALEIGKQALIGGITGGVGKIAKVILPSGIISKIGVPTAEIGTMATGGTLLEEGRLPTKEELALTAIPIAGLHVAGRFIPRKGVPESKIDLTKPPLEPSIGEPSPKPPPLPGVPVEPKEGPLFATTGKMAQAPAEVIPKVFKKEAPELQGMPVSPTETTYKTQSVAQREIGKLGLTGSHEAIQGADNLWRIAIKKEAPPIEEPLSLSPREGPKEISKTDIEKGTLYRVLRKSEVDKGEYIDHYGITDRNEAERLRGLYEKSYNEPFVIIELDPKKALEGNQLAEAKVSPEGKEAGYWIATREKMPPEAIKGVVGEGEIPLRERINPVLESMLPETSPTGHPNRRKVIAQELSKRMDKKVTSANVEASARRIRTSDKTVTDIDRQLIELIRSGDYLKLGRVETAEPTVEPTQAQGIIEGEIAKPTLPSLQQTEAPSGAIQLPKNILRTGKVIQQGQTVSGKSYPHIMAYKGKSYTIINRDAYGGPTARESIEGDYIKPKQIMGAAPVLPKVSPETSPLPIDKDQLWFIKESIKAGEPGFKTAIPETGERITQKSLFPKWFQNKGYRKGEVLIILNKAEKNKPLTTKQQQIFNDLLASSREEYLKSVPKNTEVVNEAKLDVGDIVKIEGEKFTVTEKEPNRTVLQDNEDKIVGDFKNIEIDKGSLKKGKEGKEFKLTPPEEKAVKPKPSQEEVFKAKEVETFGGKIPSEEAPKTILEKAAEEQKIRAEEKKVAEKQTTFPLDINQIPDILEVNVKAIREKTGKFMTVKDNARTAWADIQAKLETFETMLKDCL